MFHFFRSKVGQVIVHMRRALRLNERAISPGLFCQWSKTRIMGAQCFCPIPDTDMAIASFFELVILVKHCFTFDFKNDFARSHFLSDTRSCALAASSKASFWRLGFWFFLHRPFFCRNPFFEGGFREYRKLARNSQIFLPILEKEAVPSSNNLPPFFRRLKDFCCVSPPYQVHHQYPDPVAVFGKILFFVIDGFITSYDLRSSMPFPEGSTYDMALQSFGHLYQTLPTPPAALSTNSCCPPFNLAYLHQI